MEDENQRASGSDRSSSTVDTSIELHIDPLRASVRIRRAKPKLNVSTAPGSSTFGECVASPSVTYARSLPSPKLRMVPICAPPPTEPLPPVPVTPSLVPKSPHIVSANGAWPGLAHPLPATANRNDDVRASTPKSLRSSRSFVDMRDSLDDSCHYGDSCIDEPQNVSVGVKHEHVARVAMQKLALLRADNSTIPTHNPIALERSIEERRVEVLSRDQNRFAGAFGSVSQTFEELSWILSALNARIEQKSGQVSTLLDLLERQKVVMQQLLDTHKLEVESYTEDVNALRTQLDQAYRELDQYQLTIVQLKTATVVEEDSRTLREALEEKDAEIARLRSRLADTQLRDERLLEENHSLRAQNKAQREREVQIRTAYKHVRDTLRKQTDSHRRGSTDPPCENPGQDEEKTAVGLRRLSLPMVAHASAVIPPRAHASSCAGTPPSPVAHI